MILELNLYNTIKCIRNREFVVVNDKSTLEFDNVVKLIGDCVGILNELPNIIIAHKSKDSTIVIHNSELLSYLSIMGVYERIAEAIAGDIRFCKIAIDNLKVRVFLVPIESVNNMIELKNL